MVQSKEAGTTAARRQLEGRAAIVTGSTSGIGLGIAKALAAHGTPIMLNGFGDSNEIDRIVAALAEENNVDAAYDDADMSKPESIARLVENAVTRFGKVDIVVNNAGIQHVAPIEEFPDAKWEALVAINLSASFHLTKDVFAGMKSRGFGRIVNISSSHGLIASPFKSAYAAAKHGIIGLTKVTALEGAKYGVTCNAVCPGYVWTPLVEKQIGDQAKSHGISVDQVVKEVLLTEQPIGRFVTVEEVGALVAFLCTDAAAPITGTALPIDGGWTAH